MRSGKVPSRYSQFFYHWSPLLQLVWSLPITFRSMPSEPIADSDDRMRHASHVRDNASLRALMTAGLCWSGTSLGRLVAPVSKKVLGVFSGTSAIRSFASRWLKTFWATGSMTVEPSIWKKAKVVITVGKSTGSRKFWTMAAPCCIPSPIPKPTVLWYPIHSLAVEEASKVNSKPQATEVMTVEETTTGPYRPVSLTINPDRNEAHIARFIWGRVYTPDLVADTPSTAWKNMGSFPWVSDPFRSAGANYDL